MQKEQSLEGMCKDLKINPNDLQCTNDILEKITKHMLKQMHLFLNGNF